MNDLDELMSKDPLELSTADIDTIIAYQRRQRAMVESGAKRPKKEKGPALEVDLSALILKDLPKATQGTIKRRF